MKLIKKNNNSNYENTFTYFEVIIIICISILFGTILGNVLALSKSKTIGVLKDKKLVEFVETYQDITKNYYGKINKTKLIDAGIKGMVDYLDDPYSTYMDKDSASTFNEYVEGKYSGIGATITYVDNNVVIADIFKNSPAAKSKLKKGDKLISINGESLENKSLSDITSMIKNKNNTVIKLKIKRNDDEKTVKISTGTVELPSVSSNIITKNDKSVGVIDISIFASNTYKQFKSTLKELESKKIDSLVIDVRGNLGGYLDQVSEMISIFTKKGKVIYQIEEKGKKTKILDKTSEYKKYNIAVLIDSNSASASEILASALQDSYDNSYIVGINSYGKGTVQRAFSLSSGATIKYTTEKWLTPKGKWINKKGVTPDVIVELNKEHIDNPTTDNDNQLQAALDKVTQ